MRLPTLNKKMHGKPFNSLLSHVFQFFPMHLCIGSVIYCLTPIHRQFQVYFNQASGYMPPCLHCLDVHILVKRKRLPTHNPCLLAGEKSYNKGLPG